MRARMKPGVRPIVLGGIHLAPAYPTYFEVPSEDASAIEMLHAAGEVEYEPNLDSKGRFAVREVAVETVVVDGKRRVKRQG